MQKRIAFTFFLIFLVSCASPAPEPNATAMPTRTQTPIPTTTATPLPELTVVDEMAEISAIYDENGNPIYVLQNDEWVVAELNAYGLLQARASDNRVVFWNFEKQAWESVINWSDMDLTEIVGTKSRFRYNDKGTLEILSDARGWQPVVSVNEDGTLNIYHDGFDTDMYNVEREALGVAVVNGLGSRIIATVDMDGFGPVNKLMLIPEYSTFVTPIDFKDANVMNMEMGYLHFVVDVGIVERSGLLQAERLRNIPGRELYFASGDGIRIDFFPLYSRFIGKQPNPNQVIKVDGEDDPFLPLGGGVWNWNDKQGGPETGRFNVFAFNWKGKIVVFTRLGDSFDRRVGVQIHLWTNPLDFSPEGNGQTMPSYFDWSGGDKVVVTYNGKPHEDWMLISGFPNTNLLYGFWDGDLEKEVMDADASENLKGMKELQRRLTIPVWSQ